MKSGRELKLDSENKNFKILAGAIMNYKSPASVYLNITSWVRVRNQIERLDSLIKEFRNLIKNYLRTDLVAIENFTIDTIIRIDISETRLKMNKPTFFQIGLTLYQKKGLPVISGKNSKIPCLKPILSKLANDLLNMELFTNHSNFEYQLTKSVPKLEAS